MPISAYFRPKRLLAACSQARTARVLCDKKATQTDTRVSFETSRARETAARKTSAKRTARFSDFQSMDREEEARSPEDYRSFPDLLADFPPMERTEPLKTEDEGTVFGFLSVS